MLRMFSNCSVVLENLEVTYAQKHHSLAFLQSIEEVVGYVLIGMNDVAVVPLGNLRLIRGQSLYDAQFSLLVLSNYKRNPASPSGFSGLRQLQLSNLKIIRGAVKITHNFLLCNIETIQWGDIVDSSSEPSIVLEKNESHTLLFYLANLHSVRAVIPPVITARVGRQDQTTARKSPSCSVLSSAAGECRGPKPSDCCNRHCAAGCTGPQARPACRDFNDEGTCKDTCRSHMFHNSKIHRGVPNPDAKYAFGPICVKACPHNYVVTEGWCVRTCRAGMFEVEENGVQQCRECNGPCPKVCDGLGVGAFNNSVAVNASNIEFFRNCTKINGNVNFIETSFTGFQISHVRCSFFFRDLFHNIPPMDPAKLEYFRTVKEITGFLLIQSWPENLTSLSAKSHHITCGPVWLLPGPNISAGLVSAP
uniref:receptor protein-tyrosine kinase n=1 Tax=Tetraodon nigroviridis TaxID=99883 RepID=H3D7Q9_TETNG